jgi:hypothetical protein
MPNIGVVTEILLAFSYAALLRHLKEKNAAVWPTVRISVASSACLILILLYMHIIY